MKLHRALLCFLLAACFTLCGCGASVPAAEETADAAVAYNRLLEYFRSTAPALTPTFTGAAINDIPAEGYPEYYAGTYLKDGNAVILLTKGQRLGRAKRLIERVTGYSAFTYETAQYSYRRLLDEMAAIAPKVHSFRTQERQITDWSIDDRSNRLVVGLLPCTEETIAQFRAEVSDFPGIEFREGQISVPAIEEGGNP